MAIRILLADDHEVLLDGLSTLLERERDFEVVGRARTGKEAVQLALEKEPDVVIMDLTLPELSGVEATRLIRAKLTNTKVLCLSMHAERQFVSAAFNAGASGYVLKEQPLSEVVKGLHAVTRGGTYVCSATSGTVIEAYVSEKRGPAASRVDLLTPREREILQYIAEGLSTKEIARVLKLSPKTVGSHRDNIREKLNISSVAGLTRFAIRHDLTTTERKPADEYR